MLPATVQAGYERAQAAVELRAPNEDAVDASKAADADLLAAYMAYIGLEQVRASSTPELCRKHSRLPGVTCNCAPNPHAIG